MSPGNRRMYKGSSRGLHPELIQGSHRNHGEETGLRVTRGEPHGVPAWGDRAQEKSWKGNPGKERREAATVHR